MYPLSDKDLDRLSREASEQYDVEQNTSGWDKLESRLNKELPVQKEKERKRFLWLLLLLVMITGGGLFTMLQQNPAPTTVATKSNPTEQESSVAKDKNSTAINELKTETESKDLRKTNVESDNLTIAEKNTKAVADNSNIKKKEIIVAEEKTRNSKLFNSQRNQNKANPLVKERNNKYQQQEPEKIASVKKDESLDKQNELKKDELAKSNLDQNKNDKIVPPAIDKKEDIAVAEKPADKPVDTKAEKKASTKNNSKQNNSRFAIGFLTGIDKSSVHTVKSNNLGYSFGVIGQYNISKRWSVNTGLIYTKKEYTAAGEDYHPPKHYWTYYVDLKKVSGNCEMLEIPLNVRYNINQNTKNQWFANAGLSTYLMMNQNYRYYYYFTGMPGERDWNRSVDTAHVLSILNISGGFEKKLSPTFSLQAEPFVKLPLSGVGFGQMDINSYGLYLTLKYSPIKKTAATKLSK